MWNKNISEIISAFYFTCNRSIMHGNRSKGNESKAWFRRLWHYLASKWIRPMITPSLPPLPTYRRWKILKSWWARDYSLPPFPSLLLPPLSSLVLKSRPLLFPLHRSSPPMAAKGPGEHLSSYCGSGQNLAARCILVHFRHKFAPFWLLWRIIWHNEWCCRMALTR